MGSLETEAAPHFDDAEAALPYLKAQALDAATGRLSRAANDTLLFLALLAEHDDPDRAAS